jgi:Homeodomain-like domain
MDRDLLKHFIDQGMSLPQIGELFNRDPSTVGYWFQKYGLVANGRAKHAPRGGLTREQLEPLVERGATLQEIADAVDRSVSTVRHWLKRYGLVTKNRTGPRPRILRDRVEEALMNGSRTLMVHCPNHGATEFAIVGSRRRLQCKRCRSEAVARRRRRVKKILIEEFGGRCALCGYANWAGALEFHHVDPATKSFGLAERGVTLGIDRVREEAQKCVLLCANCHAEVEGGAIVLPSSANLPR